MKEEERREAGVMFFGGTKLNVFINGRRDP